jgi:hypothetical protein
MKFRFGFKYRSAKKRSAGNMEKGFPNESVNGKTVREDSQRRGKNQCVAGSSVQTFGKGNGRLKQLRRQGKATAGWSGLG